MWMEIFFVCGIFGCVMKVIVLVNRIFVIVYYIIYGVVGKGIVLVICVGVFNDVGI